jgi:hypothetical protein
VRDAAKLGAEAVAFHFIALHDLQQRHALIDERRRT